VTSIFAAWGASKHKPRNLVCQTDTVDYLSAPFETLIALPQAIAGWVSVDPLLGKRTENPRLGNAMIADTPGAAVLGSVSFTVILHKGLSNPCPLLPQHALNTIATLSALLSYPAFAWW